MNSLRINVRTELEFPIAGSLYESIDPPRGVILLASGTCIRRSFYEAMLQYLCRRRYHVISFDYVGVGDSKIDLTKMDRSIYEWGTKDIPIMIDWIKDQYNDLPKFIVAHSMGGQILGLSRITGIEKVITICSSYGNYRNCSHFKRRWGTFFASKTTFPFLTSLFGYFPASRLAMGEDWPKGVARDWICWNTRYLSLRQWMDRLHQAHYFDQFDIPMISYVMTDDVIAPPKVKQHWLIDYPSAELRVVSPNDLGVQELGHFKTFKSGAESFWNQILDDLEGNI